MSRTIALAGLLIDSWRDYLQTESSGMNLQDSATPISRLRGPSDEVPSTPRLTSLIAVGAVKWKSR
jgi:hypothetical protein